MKQIGLFFWALTCLVPVFAQAQIVKDPIADYLLFKEPAEAGNYTNLQKLIILDLDISGNGEPVKLITFNGNGGKQGNFWRAYVPVPGGYLSADSTIYSIMFREDAFYVGKLDKTNLFGLLAYWPGNGGGDLVAYQILYGKVVEKKVGSIDLSKKEDLEKFSKYFGLSPGDSKSIIEHPVTEFTLADLRKAGYDIDAALQNATAAEHSISSRQPVLLSDAVQSLPQSSSSQKLDASIEPAFSTSKSTPVPPVQSISQSSPVVTMEQPKTNESFSSWMIIIGVMLIVFFSGIGLWKLIGK